MITIANKLRRMQLFSLDHAIYCKSEKCECTEITTTLVEENPLNGKRMQREHKKKTPGTVTFIAGEKLELRDAFTQLPAVKRALEKRYLRVVAQATAPVKKRKPPASEVTDKPSETKETEK